MKNLLFWISVKVQIVFDNFALIVAGKFQLARSSPFLSKLMQPLIRNPFASIDDWTAGMSRSIVCRVVEETKIDVNVMNLNLPHLPDGSMLCQKAAAPFSVMSLAFR